MQKNLQKPTMGGGTELNPTSTHNAEYSVSTLDKDLDSTLSQDSQKVSNEKAQVTQTKQARQASTHSTLFRPIVATSLALALSASVASAQGGIGTPPNSGIAEIDTKLKWTQSDSYWTPIFKASGSPATTDSLNNLWISWNGTSNVQIDNANNSGLGVTGTTARLQLDTTRTNNVGIGTNDTNGIKFANNSGLGTLIVDFGSKGGNNKVFTIDVQSATTANAKEGAFVGNIDLYTASKNGTLNIILPKSGGKMKGNIAFKKGGDPMNVNFKNHSTIEGTIGQLTGQITTGKVVFEKGGVIDGTEATEKRAVYLSRNQTSGELFSGDTTLGITFKDTGTIRGNVEGYGIIQDSHIDNAKITIDFQKQGNITGDVISIGAFNTINFKEQGTIDGSVKTLLEGRNASEGSGNVINFYKGGTISNPNGNALASTAVSNTVNFYATKTGDTALNGNADATITGKIDAGGSAYPSNFPNGTNIINFKNASEDTPSSATSGANSIKAVLGNFETSQRNGKKGINQIISTATNLDLTTGNITGNGGGTTTIDVGGNNNTLTLGELNTSGESGAKIELFLKGNTQNTAKIAKIRNGGTDWWKHNFETTIEATGSNNTVTIGEVTNIYATADKGITISLLGTDTNKLTIGKEVSDNSSPAPTGNLTTQDNGGKTSIALGGNTATLEVQGKIDATSGKTAISFYKNNSTQNHTLTTGDILSKNNNSQVIINFGEAKPTGNTQASQGNPNGFILSSQDSTLNSPALLNTTATNKAILGNIDTQSSNGGVIISLKGSSNTLTTQNITTAHGQKGVDITSTGATNEITTGKITTFGGSANVNITLKGDSNTTNTATVAGIDSEKTTTIQLGNENDTTANNSLKLGDTLARGDGGKVKVEFVKGTTNTLDLTHSTTQESGIVEILFGSGENTIMTSDESGIITLTNNGTNYHKIQSKDGVAGTITISNDILSQGKTASNNNNGTFLVLNTKNQKIELKDTSGQAKTLTTTGMSRIEFWANQGSPEDTSGREFAGNVVSKQGEETDRDGGGKTIIFANVKAKDNKVLTHTLTGNVTAQTGGTNSFEYGKDRNILRLVGSLIAEGGTNEIKFSQTDSAFSANTIQATSGKNLFSVGATNSYLISKDFESDIALTGEAEGTNQFDFTTTDKNLVFRKNVANVESLASGELATLQTQSGNTLFSLGESVGTANIYATAIHTTGGTTTFDFNGNSNQTLKVLNGTAETNLANITTENGGSTTFNLSNATQTAVIQAQVTNAGKTAFNFQKVDFAGDTTQTLSLYKTLSTTTSGVTDFNFANPGKFVINKAGGASEEVKLSTTDNATTNFNFVAGDSQLSFKTNTDEVTLEGQGKFAFNLNGTNLTLVGTPNESKLANLELSTTGASSLTTDLKTTGGESATANTKIVINDANSSLKFSSNNAEVDKSISTTAGTANANTTILFKGENGSLSAKALNAVGNNNTQTATNTISFDTSVSKGIYSFDVPTIDAQYKGSNTFKTAEAQDITITNDLNLTSSNLAEDTTSGNFIKIAKNAKFSLAEGETLKTLNTTSGKTYVSFTGAEAVGSTLGENGVLSANITSDASGNTATADTLISFTKTGNFLIGGDILSKGTETKTASNTFKLDQDQMILALDSTTPITAEAKGTNTFNVSVKAEDSTTKSVTLTSTDNLLVFKTIEDGKNEIKINKSNTLKIGTEGLGNLKTIGGTTNIVFASNADTDNVVAGLEAQTLIADGSEGRSKSFRLAGASATANNNITFTKAGTFGFVNEMQANTNGANLLNVDKTGAGITLHNASGELRLSGNADGLSNDGNIISFTEGSKLAFVKSDTLPTAPEAGTLHTTGGYTQLNFAESGELDAHIKTSEGQTHLVFGDGKTATLTQGDLTYAGNGENLIDVSNNATIKVNDQLSLNAQDFTSGSNSITFNAENKTLSIKNTTDESNAKLAVTSGLTTISLIGGATKGNIDSAGIENQGDLNIIFATAGVSSSITLSNGGANATLNTTNASGSATTTFNLNDVATATLKANVTTNQGGTTNFTFGANNQTLALDGTITTQDMNVVDSVPTATTNFEFNQAGNYNFTKAESAKEAKLVTGAGGVTNFNFASGASTLSFGTLQDGVSPASNPIAFDDTSHAGNFVFNLKGSDLTLLGSASDSVNRIFNVSNEVVADQTLASALRETIKVTGGATTTFNLLNEGDSLTFYKGVDVDNSASSSVVNFNANHQTLNLFGASTQVSPQERTLVAEYSFSALRGAAQKQVINFVAPEDEKAINGELSTRTNFNLLTIGVDPSNGKNLVGADKGYLAENVGFRMLVNKTQALGTDTTSEVTLGGQNIDNSSQDQANNPLGHAYSDRIIIGSIGENQTPKQATLYLFPQVNHLLDIKYLNHNGNKTGTETQNNVALATVANNDKGESLVTFETEKVFVGVEEIQANLETAITDIGGKVLSDQTANANNYTTYFLGSVESRGASESMQEISATALSLNYDLFLANFNSLNKRMGELRNNPNDNGVWARVFGGQFNSNYKVKNDVDYVTTQAGYDYGFDLNGEARNYLGLAVSYATSKSSVGSLLQGTAAQNVSNSNVALSLDNVFSQGVEVALYNSYVSNVGWYSDTIFKFSYMMSEFNLKDNNFISPKAQTNNFGFVLSEEVGYRFKLGKKKEWFIDPQVELGFGYLTNNTYQTQAQAVSGLTALTGNLDAILNLRTRVGSAFGYEVQSKQTSASIYVGAFYEFDYVNGGEASTALGDSPAVPHINVLSSSGRAVLNVGSNISLQDHTRLYFDVEKSFGDKLKTHLQFNAGVRYSFGNKNPKHNRENLSKELNAPRKIEAKKGE